MSAQWPTSENNPVLAYRFDRKEPHTMGSRLKLKVTKTPAPDTMLAAKKTKVTGRMMRRIFGTTRPQHQIAVLLPGKAVDAVEVQVTREEDDLMALADAVMRHPSSVSRKAGE